MNLTGSIVNYYFHCKRQCWLAYNKINLEDNSEDVRIGKVLHELKGEKDVSIENIRLDKITNEYVTEYKKSDSDIESATAQLIFYLITLKNKGVPRKGLLKFEEVHNNATKQDVIELTDEMEAEFLNTLKEIEIFLESDIAPKAVLRSHCRKCAYFEYCFI